MSGEMCIFARSISPAWATSTKDEFLEHIHQKMKDEPFTYAFRKRKPVTPSVPFIRLFKATGNPTTYDTNTGQLLDETGSPVPATLMAQIYSPSCVVEQDEPVVPGAAMMFVKHPNGKRVVLVPDGMINWTSTDNPMYGLATIVREVWGASVEGYNDWDFNNDDSLHSYNVDVQYNYVVYGNGILRKASADGSIVNSYSHAVGYSGVRVRYRVGTGPWQAVRNTNRYPIEKFTFGDLVLSRFPLGELNLRDTISHPDISWFDEAFSMLHAYLNNSLSKADIASLVTRVGVIEDSTGEVSASVGLINERVTTLESSNSNQDEVMASNVNRITALETDVASVGDDVTSNTAEIATVVASVAAAGVAVAGITALVNALTERVDKVESDVASSREDDTYMPW